MAGEKKMSYFWKTCAKWRVEKVIFEDLEKEHFKIYYSSSLSKSCSSYKDSIKKEYTSLEKIKNSSPLGIDDILNVYSTFYCLRWYILPIL